MKNNRLIIILIIAVSVALLLLGNTTKRLEELRGELSSRADTIVTLKRQKQSLERRIAHLKADSTTLNGQVLSLELARQTVLAQSAQEQLAYRQAQQRTEDTIDRLTALQKKAAADTLAGGVGAIPTSVTDTTLNADIARLKAKLLLADEYAMNLSEANINLLGLVNERDLRITKLTIQNENAVSSSLYAESALLKEARTHRFGNLRGPATRRAAAIAADSVRATREKLVQ